MSRRTAAELGVVGAALLGLSFVTERPAPVWWRLGGLALLTLAVLVAAPAATRALARDAVRVLAPPTRAQAFALGVVVIAGVLVRLRFLGVDARYDEAFTFQTFARVPLAVGMADYGLPNNHLLHTFLMHDAWRLFGDALPVLRLPALVAGIGIVVALYAAGRALYGPVAGLLAAALGAASAPLVEYSVNGRGYTMAWLAFVVLVALSARLARRRDPAAWALWVLVAVLGVWTVPVMALPLATVGAWLGLSLLAARAPWRLAEPALASAVVAGLSALVYRETFGQAGWTWDPGLDVGPLDVAEAGFAQAHLGLPVVVRVLLAAAAVAGVLLHRRVGRTPVPLPLVALVLVPVFVVLLPRTPPYVRTWLYLLPVWLLAVGAGLAALAPLVARRRAVLVPVTAVALALGLGTVTAAGRVPYSEDDPPMLGAGDYAAWLRTQTQTSTIVDSFRIPNLAFHFRREGLDPGTIVAGYAPQVPGGAPPLLVLSRPHGDTLERRDLTGGVRPVLVRTFADGELSVYALPTQPPAA